MRAIVHYRLSGERPLCRPKEWTGMVRANLTSEPEQVTCRRCRAALQRVATALTRKVRR